MLIVSYDISNNKTRTKFSKYLNKFGHRVQYSVYEIDNSNLLIENILIDLDKKFKKYFCETDSVVIFNIKNEKNIVKYGYAKHENEGIIIV